MPNAERLTQKLQDAWARQAASKKLSTAEKLARLDVNLGKGVGAKKERAKLAKRLASEKTPPKPKTDDKNPKSK